MVCNSIKFSSYLLRELLPFLKLVEVLLAVRPDLDDASGLDDGRDEVPVLAVLDHSVQEGVVLLFHPPSRVEASPIIDREVIFFFEERRNGGLIDGYRDDLVCNEEGGKVYTIELTVRFIKKTRGGFVCAVVA